VGASLKKSNKLTKKSSEWTDSQAAGRSPHLGALARGPYLAMLETTHARLVDAGFPEVSAPYSIVFQTIGDGSRLVDMAARARTTKQNMSQLLEQMMLAGYVSRERDPLDARAAIFRMTARGRRMRRRAFGIVDRIEADWAARLGAGKMKALKKLLAELNAIIDAGRDS
jgi:DNA-binding MarR family transcriptional regulator